MYWSNKSGVLLSLKLWKLCRHIRLTVVYPSWPSLSSAKLQHVRKLKKKVYLIALWHCKEVSSLNTCPLVEPVSRIDLKTEICCNMKIAACVMLLRTIRDANKPSALMLLQTLTVKTAVKIVVENACSPYVCSLWNGLPSNECARVNVTRQKRSLRSCKLRQTFDVCMF